MGAYNPNEKLYLCDPQKNRDCKKTSCFINYGPCKFTKDKKYAVTDENGKALGYTIAQYDALMKRRKGEKWPATDPIDGILDTLEYDTSGLVDE